ncbi:MAG: long-chain-acyl-CoA synthetase [Methylobacteriaceae bacterium]|nr:long-chain-acyl-CoA synthetase [Methylobacteriaceae bacterium]
MTATHTSPIGPAPHREGASAAAAWALALARTGAIGRDGVQTLSEAIAGIARERPDAPAIVDAASGAALSFSDLDRRAARYARWAQEAGLGPGTVAALLLPNGPDYLPAWLGLTRAGATVALPNTSLTGASLAHCLQVASPQVAIVAAGLVAPYGAASARLAAAPTLLVHGAPDDPDGIEAALARQPDEPLAEGEMPALALRDRALCIYTSGTTGLPKAANVSHGRILTWGHWFSALAGLDETDRLYDCLPMFHSVGGVVAPGAALLAGGALVVAERFSARRFWDEVAEHDCTVFQYIGELCRYLLAAPTHPLERRHGLRLALGNGLGAKVWEPFQERFAIPRIVEFYAATEGTVSLTNVEGRVGAVGRVPPILAHRSPAILVHHDPETGLPARGSDGFCRRAAVGETGELLGRIEAAGAQRFEGYTDGAESERKILRDVFKPGDAWLRTGDLMRTDRQGYFYFVDRVGDTFRWKGENVATSEVAEIAASAPGVVAAAIYGVRVPGAEGRAGMAALATNETFDLAVFRERLVRDLPAYARPIFLRLCPDLATTDTLKIRKDGLAAQGYDLERVADPIFIDDPIDGAYRPFTPELHRALLDGTLRL